MKRKVSVTIEKTVELEIKDECLTDEFLDEFESCIGELDVDQNGNRINDLFSHAAAQIALYESISFVEGIGRAGPDYIKNRPEGQDVKIFSCVTFEDVVTEVEEITESEVSGQREPQCQHCDGTGTDHLNDWSCAHCSGSGTTDISEYTPYPDGREGNQ